MLTSPLEEAKTNCKVLVKDSSKWDSTDRNFAGFARATVFKYLRPFTYTVRLTLLDISQTPTCTVFV